MKVGWKKSTIGDIGRVFNGNSISESKKKTHFEGLDKGVPYIGTKDVGFNHEIEYESGVKIPDGKQDGFKLAPPNTVLVCAEGGSAGRKIAYTDREVFFGNKLFAICPTPPIDSRFVFYYCLAEDFKEQFKSAMAGLIGGVSLSKFKDISISIPPLPEQQRIIAMLDKSFIAFAITKANAEKNLQNARALLESQLQSVFTQHGPKWVEKPLVELCDPARVITYGVIKLGQEILDGVPCLRTSNVRWLRIDTEGIKKIAPSLSSEYSRTILRGGEVLVNVRGTLGGVAVVTPQMAGWNVSREVAVVPVDHSKVNPIFLSYLIGSGVSQQWLGGVKKGTAYVGINIEDLRLLPVSAPTMDEQLKIISKLETLQSSTQRLESIYQQKLNDLEELKKSVLHKGFNGELAGVCS